MLKSKDHYFGKISVWKASVSHNILRLNAMTTTALTVAAYIAIASAQIGSANASTILFTNRSPFVNALSKVIIDDYENPGYQIPLVNVLPDEIMSAVLGETKYRTTGFLNANMTEGGIAPNNYEYCAGCNGSYLMDFTSTSVGTSTGVYGIGFDYYNPNGAFHAFVTFGDYSATDYTLTGGITRYSFFGITSDLEIRSIHMGLANGLTTQEFSFAQDNLTVGSKGVTGNIPEPGTLALLGIALAGLSATRGRKHE